MTLPRPLTWEYLLPPETVFAGSPIPEALDPRGYHRCSPEGRPFLLAHRLSARELPRLDRHDGLVAINCPDINLSDLRAAGFGSVRRFIVIPSMGEARLFVPITDGPTARAAFGLVRPRVGWRGRLELGLARAAAGAGLLPATRQGDQLLIAQRSAGPLEQLIQRALPDRPFHLALTSGGSFPDERRKPAIAVIGEGGRTLAFGNLGDAESPRRLLSHQSQMLRVLEGRFGAAWRGPRLLGAGESGRAYVLLQSAVDGRPCGIELTPDHFAFLEALRGGPAKPAVETHLMRNLDQALPPAGDERRAFQVAAGLLSNSRFEQTLVHGDFQPENLRRSPDGVIAFDWEYGDLDGLPLFDTLYHVIHTGLISMRCSVEQTIERLDDCYRRLGAAFTTEQKRAMSIVCALSFSTRLIGDAERPGSLISQLTELSSILARPASALEDAS